MNRPALKREVSRIKKMLKLTNPRLRRFDVVVDGFHSGVADTSKEFSRAPEVSISKMVSQPGMFFEKAKGAITFKQLEGFANTHRSWQLNKQVDMINSDVEFIDFTLLPVGNLPQEKLTVHPQSIELKGISCVFNFPHEVEGVLSEAMLPRSQIHFSSPEHSSNYVQFFISGGLVSRPSDSNHSEILNIEDGDSSPNLKVWVSSPLM